VKCPGNLLNRTQLSNTSRRTSKLTFTVCRHAPLSSKNVGSSYPAPCAFPNSNCTRWLAADLAVLPCCMPPCIVYIVYLALNLDIPASSDTTIYFRNPTSHSIVACISNCCLFFCIFWISNDKYSFFLVICRLVFL